MADPKLLPCPFCGSDQVAVRGGRPSAACPRVQCTDCGARGPEWLSSFFGLEADLEPDVAAVIEAWNQAPRRDGTHGGLFPASEGLLREAVEAEREEREQPLSAEDAEMLANVKANVLGKGGDDHA